nr:hypothetical protein [Tanacetum cinerariifolium]
MQTQTSNTLHNDIMEADSKYRLPMLAPEQADWRDDTDDDELEDHELEAHYMYMAQLQEVSSDAANSGPIFDAEPLQKVSNDDHYNVFAIESEHPEQSESVHVTYPIEQDAHIVIIDSFDISYDREEIDQHDDDNDLANEPLESDEVIHLEKESRSKLSDIIRPFDYNKLNNLYDLFVPQREKSSEQRYFSERSRLSHTSVNNGNSKESFNKQATLLEKRMDESIPKQLPQNPTRNITRKLYERVSKTCSWWYPKFTPSGYKWKPKSRKENVNPNLVEIVLFIIDSGYSKHMTGNLKLLINCVEKFLGTVKFGNDQIAPIIGYGDLVQGAVTIKRVYYVEGLNHNLFSIGQFCVANLEVAFRKSTCYIRDLKGNDLLIGSRSIDLYSMTLQDTNSPNPICLMAKATSSQAWLCHRRLSHLNFDTINLLSKNDIVVGIPKLKFVKDHLCSSCELGKAKRKSFHTKTTPSSKTRLQLQHMDLCGPMRVASINGKRYVLVIVDDYSIYTWTHFLRSKDETPEVLIDFLRLVQRGLQAHVRVVQTDKGTEFLNQTLHAYFAAEGILHQTSVARTPEQNGVVERRNRTLVEAARTMLSAAKVPLFFCAEAIATTCFTQNRSLVIPQHEKTPYHIINDRKSSVKFFHIFGSLCYIVRDGENLDKMKEKGDACIFVGYSTQSRAYKVFNKRTRVIVETIQVNFDELPQMASNHVSSYPVSKCQRMALEHDSLSPDTQCQENVTQVYKTFTMSNELDLLFSLMFDELLNGSSKVMSKSSAVKMVEEYAQVENGEFINIFCTPVQDKGETSLRLVDLSNMHTFYQHHPSEDRWTKDHPLEQVIGNPSQSVRTRRQLESNGDMCMFALTESYKNVSQDIRDQLNAKDKAVEIILTGIDNDIYSIVDACPNLCEMWKAIERLKQGESINVQDLETNLYWKFGK